MLSLNTLALYTLLSHKPSGSTVNEVCQAYIIYNTGKNNYYGTTYTVIIITTVYSLYDHIYNYNNIIHRYGNMTARYRSQQDHNIP